MYGKNRKVAYNIRTNVRNKRTAGGMHADYTTNSPSRGGKTTTLQLSQEHVAHLQKPGATRADQRVAGLEGAIDAARAYFRATDPLKEQFMVRLFGLETAIPRNQLTRARMVQLQAELCVTESTLYKWREDIFEIVLYAAIECGLIHPFGLARKADEPVFEQFGCD